MDLPNSLNVGPYEGRTSFVVVPVLQFLWGKPWDEVAASWISTLEPRVVRHSSDGGIQLSAVPGRVTVFTDGAKWPMKIERIQLESHVTLFGRLQDGDELTQRTPQLEEFDCG